MRLYKKHARKVLDIVDQGLCYGAGKKPVPGQVCVEQAVCMALDLPFSDNPECVDSTLRQFKIRLNDANWSSDAARAKGLRRLAVVQLGTKDTLDTQAFRDGLVKLAIGKWLPKCLRLTAERQKEPDKTKLLEAAEVCEKDPTYENAKKAHNAAVAYAAAVAVAAAADAAAYAAVAAVAAVAAAVAAAAVAVAVAAAADAAAAAAARDEFLTECGEDVVQLLISINAYGCRFLPLTEKD